MIEPQWIAGFAGGLMIGVAGAVFLLVNGRVMGASGILGGLIDGSGRDNRGERMAFLAGLVLLPLLIGRLFVPVVPGVTSSLALVAVAGLLVGIGTRLANGCTSGHGVCGISRLSWRALVATLTFMLAGALTMALFRHGLGVI